MQNTLAWTARSEDASTPVAGPRLGNPSRPGSEHPQQPRCPGTGGVSPGLCNSSRCGMQPLPLPAELGAPHAPERPPDHPGTATFIPAGIPVRALVWSSCTPRAAPGSSFPGKLPKTSERSQSKPSREPSGGTANTPNLSTPSTNPKCIHCLRGVSFRGSPERLEWAVGFGGQLQPLCNGSGQKWAGPLPTPSPAPCGHFAGIRTRLGTFPWEGSSCPCRC